ncbi:MAG: arylsulfatase A-like enzyme [Planctomycetota bacterium]|jgi:arylsulfatase A-like enzyme
MLGAGLCLTLLCIASCSPDAPIEPKPDVFMVVVDTLRKDRLGCYGYERDTSPRIDEIASQGTLFLDPNAQASWTRPSMISLMTGRYMTAFRDVVPEDYPTLAESFAAAGYRTIGIVGNVLVSEEAGFARGFEHFDASYSEEANTDLGELGRDAPGILRDVWKQLDGGDPERDGEDRRPLFVYVHIMDPHHPWLIHREYLDELPLNDSAPIDSWMMETYRSGVEELAPWDERFESWKRVRSSRGRYEAEVRFTDHHIGAFFDGLSERGLLERGIFAFVADHGEVLWERLDPKPIWEKDAPTLPKNVMHAEHGFFITQELIGTPFILWGKGIPVGLKVETPVENLDLFPTLLELCDVKAPGDLHGESLIPWLVRASGSAKPSLDADQAPLHDYVYSFVLQRACVREVSSGWKLSLPEAGFDAAGVVPELYKLDVDPLERDNRFKHEPDVVSRLRAKLAEWKHAHPTESSFGRKLSQKEGADLRALGYLGDDEESDDD